MSSLGVRPSPASGVPAAVLRRCGRSACTQGEHAVQCSAVQCSAVQCSGNNTDRQKRITSKSRSSKHASCDGAAHHVNKICVCSACPCTVTARKAWKTDSARPPVPRPCMHALLDLNKLFCNPCMQHMQQSVHSPFSLETLLRACRPRR
jgi:hypothetical protein